MEKVSETVADTFQYAKPQRMEAIPAIEEDTTEVVVPSPPKPPENIIEPPKLEKVTLEEVKTKASNTTDVWKEAFGIVKLASGFGVEYLGLEKGDRELVKQWDKDAKQAREEDAQLAFPEEYYEAKERIDEFETNISQLKNTGMPESVRDMIYQAYLAQYKKKADKFELKADTPLEALLKAFIIMIGDSIRLAVFKAILKAVTRINR